MVSKIKSMGIFGMRSFMVEVEADVSGGKFRFDIVGLPDAAVSEAKERVHAAIRNSGYGFPLSHITVNLAPADVKKAGSTYDLPMFIAILVSARQINFNSCDDAFIGELSLSGDVRRLNGVLPMVIEAKRAGIKRVFVPEQNAREASVVEGIEVYAVDNVKNLLSFLIGKEPDDGIPYVKKVCSDDFPKDEGTENILDFADVKGQKNAKRALEIAAAGGHNILMVGPPGSGKSMLAKRIPTILPDMTFDEAIETTKLYSIAGELRENAGLIRTRPFRSPHHTVSAVGLSGGGSIPKPGEISLAHNGVLFLDELPEFSRSAMEVMRQPIEDGKISISRVAGTITFPCSVMLVAAMNPCPCGYLGHPVKQCNCPQGAAEKYKAKISGPLLDRIDLRIEVPSIDYDELTNAAQPEEKSESIRARVNAAREIQRKRFEGTSVFCNAKMNASQVRQFCILDDNANELLRRIYDKLGLSVRAHDKILKISRTIADLDNSEKITVSHLAEAIRFRDFEGR